jgi:PAS domain S-box-containing protein
MSSLLSADVANFLDQVPLCVSLRVPGKPYLFLNRNAREFFDVPPENRRLSPTDIFPEDYAQRVEVKDLEVIHGTSKFWFHDHVQPKRTGDERWVNESMFPVRLGAEQETVIARFFLPYFENPSQLPSFIYQELRKVLDKLETTGIFVKDAQGRFVYVNKALANRLERKRRQILGKTDSQLLSSAEQIDHFVNDDQTLFARAKQEGHQSKMMIGDEPLTSPSGRKYILDTQKQIVWYGKEPRYLVGLANDVTEIRKQKEELEKKQAELEEEHRFITTILSSVSEAMYALDKDSKFLWVNPSLRRLFGLNDSECVKGKMHDEGHPCRHQFLKNV